MYVEKTRIFISIISAFYIVFENVRTGKTNNSVMFRTVALKGKDV